MLAAGFGTFAHSPKAGYHVPARAHPSSILPSLQFGTRRLQLGLRVSSCQASPHFVGLYAGLINLATLLGSLTVGACHQSVVETSWVEDSTGLFLTLSKARSCLLQSL